jgi:formylglycine-generating enzyme required for sulfatase activity
VRCRGNNVASIAEAIHPDATTIGDAVIARHAAHGGKHVIVLDQLESALAEASPKSDLVREILGFDRWPAGADISIVLTIREDYLARLVTRTQEIEAGVPILRLPPLGPGGARDAITAPLTEARLAIEPELLETLLSDLQRAAAALGPEMGWGASPAVYPPHLQLACTVLYEALAPGSATLTLAHYRRLGGFDAIVGEYLERVLDTELADGRDVIARDLFVALVTTAHERAMRPETDLISIVGSRHGTHEVRAVLETLRSRGLLVRVRDASGEPGWELVHDSLVPRVLAWIDRRDLDRRRAIELVRYHLRRSRPDAPSLLGRAELRELAPYASAITELDKEWSERGDGGNGWTPSRLVDRSKQVLRRRVATIATVLIASLSIASFGFYRSHVERVHSEQEASLRNRDLGRFVLSLEPYDWDPVAQQSREVAASLVPSLSWKIHAIGDDPSSLGLAYSEDLLIQSGSRIEGNARVVDVEARGGAAVLVISRGPCSPSLVPLRQLPGYAKREQVPPVFHVRVPTCAASAADMIAIPRGSFLFGGLGDPISTDVAGDPGTVRERTIDLPAFRIDRLEVTNAAFGELAKMASITDVAAPSYPAAEELGDLDAPRRPVTGIDWIEARAFCRFHGKELPSSKQWTRAMRGGLKLPDGSPNPAPRRNLPWGTEIRPQAAKVLNVGSAGVADGGQYPEDRSPEGVFDLAGNVSEWIGDAPASGGANIRMVRGGNVFDTPVDDVVNYVAMENPRPMRQRHFGMGVRCVAPGL